MEMPLELPAESVKAVGFHDPLQPPINDPATRGRIPYTTPSPMFLMLFMDAEEADIGMQALMVLMPEVGRWVSEGIGNQLMKHDSRYKQRWAALKDSTIAARRRRGRSDSYPYSDSFAYLWQTNRWNTALTVQNQSVTAGIGPSEALQTHSDWSKTHLSQYGTPPGHGDGPGNTQQKVARPLGMSEEIARSLQNYLNQRLPTIMKNLGAKSEPKAILAPDMMQAELPLWVQ